MYTYPPFVLPAELTNSDGTLRKLDELRDALVALPRNIARDPATNELPISGFDVGMTELVLNDMLGFDVTYVKLDSMVEFYLALRSGECDVAVTAAELEVTRAICDPTCPAAPLNMTGFDYADNIVPDQLMESLCCLAYGASYLMSGFSLVSNDVHRKLNAMDLVFSAPVVNMGLVLFVMLFVAGWIYWLFEWQANTKVSNPGYGVYWAITTISTVGYGDFTPVTTMGRTLASVWMIISVILVSIFTSILTSTFTSSQILSVPIDTLSAVKGGLCIEPDYPSVQEFVAREASRPKTIIEAEVPHCFDLLAAGAVQAVLTDRPIITWFADMYDVEGLYVSPVLKPNPFSFVYRNSADSVALRSTINPAVIAATIDPVWIAQAEQLKSQYAIGEASSAALNMASASSATDVLNHGLLNAAIVLAVVTGAVSLLAHGRDVLHETKASFHAAALLFKDHAIAAHGGATRFSVAAATAAGFTSKRDDDDSNADAEVGAGSGDSATRAGRLQQLARQSVGGESSDDTAAAHAAQLAELTQLAHTLVAKIQALEASQKAAAR